MTYVFPVAEGISKHFLKQSNFLGLVRSAGGLTKSYFCSTLAKKDYFKLKRVHV